MGIVSIVWCQWNEMIFCEAHIEYSTESVMITLCVLFSWISSFSLPSSLHFSLCLSSILFSMYKLIRFPLSLVFCFSFFSSFFFSSFICHALCKFSLIYFLALCKFKRYYTHSALSMLGTQYNRDHTKKSVVMNFHWESQNSCRCSPCKMLYGDGIDAFR